MLPTSGPRRHRVGEPAATNICLQSQSINVGPWATGNVTLVDGATAPDGTATAETMTDNATSGEHRFFQNIAVTNGATYTSSIYVKAGTAGFAQLADNASAHWARFDLDAVSVLGITGTGTVARIEAVANGWRRISMTFPAANASNYLTMNMCTNSTDFFGYVGTGSTILVWGAQMELGSVATSYIVTTSAAVTRAAKLAPARVRLR